MLSREALRTIIGDAFLGEITEEIERRLHVKFATELRDPTALPHEVNRAMDAAAQAEARALAQALFERTERPAKPKAPAAARRADSASASSE